MEWNGDRFGNAFTKWGSNTFLLLVFLLVLFSYEFRFAEKCVRRENRLMLMLKNKPIVLHFCWIKADFRNTIVSLYIYIVRLAHCQGSRYTLHTQAFFFFEIKITLPKCGIYVPIYVYVFMAIQSVSRICICRLSTHRAESH